MSAERRWRRRFTLLAVVALFATLPPAVPVRAITQPPGDPPGTPPPLCAEGVPEPCMVQSWLGRFTVSPHVAFEGDLYTLTWESDAGGSMPAWPASDDTAYRTQDCPTIADNTSGGTFTCTYRLLVGAIAPSPDPDLPARGWPALTVEIVNTIGDAVAQDAFWTWPTSYFATVRVEDLDANPVSGPEIDIRVPAHTILTYEGDTPLSVFRRSGLEMPGVSSGPTIQDLAAANPHLADRFAAGHFIFGDVVQVPEAEGTIPFNYRPGPWDGSWETGLLFRTGNYEMRARLEGFRDSGWIPVHIVDDTSRVVLPLRETLEPHAAYTVSENPAPGSRRFVSTSTPGATEAPIVEWQWSFGDGGEHIGANATIDHQYAEPGEYFTQLTVIDAEGRSDTAAMVVDATAPDLTVTVTADLANVKIGDTVPVEVEVAVSAGGFGALTDLTFVDDGLQVFPAGRGTAAPLSPPADTPFTLQPGESRTFAGSVEILTGGHIEILATVTGFDEAGAHVSDTHSVTGLVEESALKVTFSAAPCVREQQQPVYRCVVDFPGGEDPAPVDVELTVKVENPSAATVVNDVIIDQDLALSATGREPLGGRLVETEGPLEAGEPLPAGRIGTLLPGESRSLTYHVRAEAPGAFAIEVSAAGDAQVIDTGGGGGVDVRFSTGYFRAPGPRPVTADGEMRLLVGDALVVNDDGDSGDADTGDGTCDTMQDADPDTTQCTLRAAIQESNARQAAGRGAQAVEFDIPGAAVPKITPQSTLPDVEGTVAIDGTTQPGGSVQLDGFLRSGGEPGTLVPLPTGIRLTGVGTQVRGLAMEGFAIGVVLAGQGDHSLREMRITRTDTGVRVESSGNSIGATSPDCANPCNVLTSNGALAQDDPDYLATGGNVVVAAGAGTVIAGNAIDWDPQGAPSWSAIGIVIRAGAAAKVGPGNVIGKAGVGIVVAGTATIVGNHIGISPDGTQLAEWVQTFDNNPRPGIWVSPSGSATIGGPAPADGNVIAGWGPRPGTEQPDPIRAAGILVDGSGTVIRNNRIGTDPGGQTAIGNWRGVVIGREGSGPGANENVALGTVVEDNVISGNEIGVLSLDTTATIAGNRIGTNPAGTAAVPNGIGIRSAGLVGGTRADGETACSSPCNLISGNSVAGLAALAAAGNFIGTTLDGAGPLPNAVGVIGFWQDGAPDDRSVALVGGPSHATQGVCDLACNLIAFNEFGVALAHSPPTRGPIQISGNVIADQDRTGVILMSRASGSQIGGSSDMDGNLITRNGEAGIAVFSEATDIAIRGNVITDNLGEGVLLGRDFRDPARVTIRANRISDNGRLGIDLSVAPTGAPPDGPTDNDFYSDADSGPNGLQNKPVEGKAMRFSGVIQVLGRFERPPEQLLETYVIDLFANAACDPSGFGEGERPIAEVANIGLDGRWEALVNTASTPAYITATITGPNGDTSEFGPCWPVMRAARTSASVSVGARLLPVSDNDGFPIGDQVALDPDGPSEEVHTVTGHGSLLLGDPLAFDHPAGTIVLHLGTPPDTAITSGPAEGDVIAEPTASFGIESPDPDATFQCSLDGADWVSCSSPRALSGLLDGPHTFAVRAVLEDGRFDPSPAARTFSVNTSTFDTTPPLIAFTGLGTYDLLETVELGCTFDDPESGIDTGACTVPPPAPGWTFGPGPEPVSAAATNGAGSIGTEEGEFLVTATADTLCTLTEQFSAKKHEKDLCNHLRHAAKEQAKGKAKQVAHQIDEYVKKVQKDRKAFTAEEQATLVAFARSLCGVGRAGGSGAESCT